MAFAECARVGAARAEEVQHAVRRDVKGGLHGGDCRAAKLDAAKPALSANTAQLGVQPVASVACRSSQITLLRAQRTPNLDA